MALNIFRNRVRKRIERFSSRLMGVAGHPLPTSDVDDWWIETTNYYVYPASRPWNGWELMLEAAPKASMIINTDDGRLAWVHHISPPLPSEWHYRYEGTSTENLPPPDLQAAIIHEVITTAELTYPLVLNNSSVIAEQSSSSSSSSSSNVMWSTVGAIGAINYSSSSGTSNPTSIANCRFCGKDIDFAKGCISKGEGGIENQHYFCNSACSISFDQIGYKPKEIEEEIESRFDILDL
jgi:hypothetical protein